MEARIKAKNFITDLTYLLRLISDDYEILRKTICYTYKYKKKKEAATVACP
jgi:type IV secretory pathway TrbF-like protein